MNKIKEIIEKVKATVKAVTPVIDERFKSFIPDDKLRKILYIVFASIAGLFGLIIILGILIAPLRKSSSGDGLTLNKTKVIQESPKPDEIKTENQKKIDAIKKKLNDIKFPESRITPPVVVTEIKFN